MLVIGLDGATWSVIKPNLDKLPNLKQLVEKYEISTLECDVRPVHSAPSWTTIFTGLTPEEHGVKNFIMEKSKREEVLKRGFFIWDKVSRPIVMMVPNAMPPLSVNYELKKWESVVLSITSEEMKESTRVLLQDTINAIEYGEPNLLISIFYEPDRAQHIYWHDKSKVLEHYVNVDSALGKLMPFLEKDDFLILSDHGFTNASETKSNNWDVVQENQSGGHHPNGIAISNKKPPLKVSEVFNFIKNAMQI